MSAIQTMSEPPANSERRIDRPFGPPGRLEVEHTAEGETLILVLRGELDHASVAMLQGELGLLGSGGFRRLVIDLGGLEFMDSSGIAALIDGQRAAATDRRQLTLRDPRGEVQQVLELTGVLDHFIVEH